MIVNYEYSNSKLMVSYIDPRGKLQFKNYSMYNPMQWTVTHERDQHKSDTYKTWDGKPVKLMAVRYPNRYTIYDFLRNLPKAERDDIFAFNNPQMFFCDIEVEVTDGFPEAHKAENPITAVCVITGDKVFLMGLKPLTDAQISKMETEMNEHFKHLGTKYKIQWHFCEDEHELLNIFFNNLLPKMPVLTGWNFVGYDWVYFVTRARKLGINPDVASPTGRLVRPWKKNENAQKPTFEELPMHRLVFDYMDIFNKWDQSIKIKENEKLDFISSKVLGVKKLEYEGSIKDLYHKEWYKYCLYNCIDTALVQLIHEKQRTFDLMLAISNLASIQIADSLSAIRVTEGIFFEEYKNVGIVMAKQHVQQPILDLTGDDVEPAEEDLEGGYVKYPSIGLKSWISVFDFESLYPKTMIQYNIGPETFRGMKVTDTTAILNGREYHIKDNDIVLLNGAVFENSDGKTKEIITNLFARRKSNKATSLDHKIQRELIKQYAKKRFA